MFNLDTRKVSIVGVVLLNVFIIPTQSLAQSVAFGTMQADANALMTLDNDSKSTSEALRIKGLPTQQANPVNILVFDNEYVRSFPIAGLIQAAGGTDTVVKNLEVAINNRLVLTDTANNTFEADLTPFLSLGAVDQSLTDDRIIETNGHILDVQGDVRFGRYGKYYNDPTVIADFGNGTKDTARSAMTIFEDGSIHVTGNLMSASDRRLKENIESWGAGLQTVMALETVTFNWKEDQGPAGQQVGFIAQNVQEALPQAVVARRDNLATLSVDNRPLIAATVSAIQELVEVNEKLSHKIKELEERLAALEEDM